MIVKHSITCLALLAITCALSGCSKKEAPPSSAPSSTKNGASATKAPDAPAGLAGHGGNVIELGATKIGPFTVRASRDEGRIEAGGDAPIDVWLTGSDAAVVAVRFWIGVESAAGSVKAKAVIEDPAQPNHWHTHAEVPNPMPTGSMLWVEIEIEGQGKKTGSFGLGA